ncbi:hypothetical protein [Marinobacter zhejiangensis]|uniref:Uncharacterized protein n=1 Tax=Marinobacter zhejiangensis TaxID=488535 RepID=A0A1I4P295_9GAMM|nr:hypothetical protein [Marinobacter zhejiangensis]SFM21964.1 hypothetical protein SAMN04487963_1771 [Marinobacter zhejiangensis]
MSSGYDLYQSQAFRDELEKCQVFYLKHPRGGHYNDGFELLGVIETGSAEELLALLGILGVPHTLHKQKPECWCPPPLEIGGETLWLEYENRFECFGFPAYVTVGTSNNTVEFNFNSISCYDVTLDDVKRAVAFEEALRSQGILKN